LDFHGEEGQGGTTVRRGLWERTWENLVMVRGRKTMMEDRRIVMRTIDHFPRSERHRWKATIVVAPRGFRLPLSYAVTWGMFSGRRRRRPPLDFCLGILVVSFIVQLYLAIRSISGYIEAIF
jgi:hypothetical protein